MRAFVMSIVAVLVLTGLGVYVLDNFLQETADQSFANPTSARLPHEESGHNLVGKDWSSAKEH